MEWVETTGRTVEEALEAALDELGVHEEDLEYEVLEQPRSGLLGRFRSGARVRARVKPLSREKPGERQRRKGRSGQSRPGGGRDGRDGRSGRDGGRAQGSGDRTRGGGRSDRDAEGSSASAGPGRSESSGAAAAGSGSRRRRRGGRGRGSGAPRSADGAARDETVSDARKGTMVETTESDVTIEEQADAAEEFTRGLIDAFDLGAQVGCEIVDDGIAIEVTGDNLGLLVGPKGATLSAIEELVRTVVQRQTDGHGVRINVDVAGYRAKRREALAEFTRGVADKVLETGRAQALEPMSAADRKVVHDTAAEIEGVGTESEGEEPRRRVVLVPTGGD
jgi:spoIIIJ-associated protein